MTDPQLSVDALLELLQNERRRYLLYCLDQEADEVVTLDELTAMILDWERQLNGEPDRPTSETERRVRLSLHHNHLPRLEEASLVEYDPRSETVRNSDVPDAVALAEVGEDETPHLQSLFGMSVRS